ncbi:uncharacterized protein LOC143377921 [Andrena cerasifolii]|uniref:uncharacterized protein LOC143377921 n=1 Tax=Andrena cerasifolii TaxID=2819439 RepID=UPI00403810AD
MILTDTPVDAFDKISMDIVGPLPFTNTGNSYILTIQDNLTKYSLAIPLANITSEDIAEAFTEHFICKFAASPKAILTDQGPNFISSLMKKFARAFHIKQYRTSAFHPQSNGSLERSHHVLVEKPTRFFSKFQKRDLRLFSIDIADSPSNERIKIPHKVLVRYLGIQMDNLARMSKHGDIQLNKARKAFYSCGRLFYSRNLSDRAKIICYMLLIRPIMTYAAPTWFNVNAATMEKLRKKEREEQPRMVRRQAILGLKTEQIRKPPSILLSDLGFNGEEATLMIDTGSDLNVIKRSAVSPNIPIFTDTLFDLNGITDGLLSTIGYIKIRTLNTEIIIHVVEDLPIKQDGILGTEFFQTNGATIDYMKSAITIGMETIPFIDPEMVTIPARTRRRARIVIDFRKLNEKIIGDAYPLPNITDILDQLGSAKYFSVFDLASGFHQIPMHPDHRHKTAFSTIYGHYEFNRMPFGLKNAPATFQRLMDQVLTGLQGIELFVYLDDIVIYASSMKEHATKFKRLMNRLRDANLYLQPDKCEFLKKEVSYLGHIIGEEGVKPDPKKIIAVKEFPTPTTVKNVKQFLGLSGYYRRFIKDFSRIARPLSNLTKKDYQFEWTYKQQKAFETLREALCKEPILQFPDFEKTFNITTDASGIAVGAVLSQGEIGKDLPVAYASRVLNDAETRYSPTERELLAIIYAVFHFRPYIYGRKFYLITDHKPLEWHQNLSNPTSRLVRWKIKLAEYDYKILYKPGNYNTNADVLSGNPISLPLNAKRAHSETSSHENKKHKQFHQFKTRQRETTASTSENPAPYKQPRISSSDSDSSSYDESDSINIKRKKKQKSNTSSSHPEAKKPNIEPSETHTPPRRAEIFIPSQKTEIYTRPQISVPVEVHAPPHVTEPLTIHTPAQDIIQDTTRKAPHIKKPQEDLIEEIDEATIVPKHNYKDPPKISAETSSDKSTHHTPKKKKQKLKSI